MRAGQPSPSETRKIEGIFSQQCETASERDLRIFGGQKGETEPPELRGLMLNVVVGLFDGIDYDDALC